MERLQLAPLLTEYAFHWRFWLLRSWSGAALRRTCRAAEPARRCADRRRVPVRVGEMSKRPRGNVVNPMFETLMANDDDEPAAPSSTTGTPWNMAERLSAIGGGTPWRDDAHPLEEKVRLFVKVVAVAHRASEKSLGLAKTSTPNVLDQTIACNLAARVWDYELARLHQLAAQTGADPVRVLRASSKGLPGLKQCSARESLIAFLIMRLDKQPPSEAEEELRLTMAGLGCVLPDCQHAATGAPCVQGCQWDESGEGIDAVERHAGLVKLRV